MGLVDVNKMKISSIGITVRNRGSKESKSFTVYGKTLEEVHQKIKEELKAKEMVDNPIYWASQERDKYWREELQKVIVGTVPETDKDGTCIGVKHYLIDAKKFNKLRQLK